MFLRRPGGAEPQRQWLLLSCKATDLIDAAWGCWVFNYPVAARAKKSHLVAIVLNASEDDGANADTSSHHPMQQQTFFIFCRNHHSAVQTNLSVYSWLSLQARLLWLQMRCGKLTAGSHVANGPERRNWWRYSFSFCFFDACSRALPIILFISVIPHIDV